MLHTYALYWSCADGKSGKDLVVAESKDAAEDYLVKQYHGEARVLWVETLGEKS